LSFRWGTRAVRDLRNDGLLVYSRKYDNAFRAVIESALVTWVGILIYEITLLAPMGHITTKLNVGYVMLQIIPIFFGISQSLIVARVGLAREKRTSEGIDYDFASMRLRDRDLENTNFRGYVGHRFSGGSLGSEV